MISKLPKLIDPPRYGGLYIFDFGDRVAVGYTAEEIECLLAEPEYASGRIYKIHRAHTDGTLEIHGVNPAGWSRMTGMVFWFAEEAEARSAWADLRSRALAIQPPGLIDISICRRAGEPLAFALVIRYVQELDEAVSAWLLELDYNAGVIVEAGAGQVERAVASAEKLECDQLQPAETYRSRSKDEVLASTHIAVQR